MTAPTIIDPIERRPLGRTKLTVSRLGVGGDSSFGRAGDAGAQVLTTCWDAGLRHFDGTALWPGRERAALWPGAACAPARRTGAVDESGPQRAGQLRLQRERSHALDRGQPRALGLGRIDLVSIHDLDRDKHGDQFDACYEQALSGANAVLQALRSSGEIGAVGVGLSSPDVALRIARIRTP